MTQRRLIRDRRVVTDDWTHLEDAAPLPSSGACTVSYARWVENRESLRKRGDIGVRIPPELEVSVLQEDVETLPLIALSFCFIQPRPEGGRTFDGRAYSQATLLRNRYGFRGELRATGEIFQDVIHAMGRCGINAIEVKAGLDPEQALKAFADFSLAYQGAADGQPLIFRRRRA